MSVICVGITCVLLLNLVHISDSKYHSLYVVIICFHVYYYRYS